MKPLLSLDAELDYRLRYSNLFIEDNEFLFLELQATPLFTGCNPYPEDDVVVYHIFHLIESGNTSGTMCLLTCECDYAEDAGIYGRTTVIHEKDMIIWQMCIKDFQPIIDQQWHDAYVQLQLIFSKAQYRNTIRNMLIEIQECLKNPIVLHTLRREDFTRSYDAYNTCQTVIEKYPQHPTVPVETLNPHDATSYDAILALNPDELFY